MPTIMVYISQKTYERLKHAERTQNVAAVTLAENAIEEAALDYAKTLEKDPGQEYES